MRKTILLVFPLLTFLSCGRKTDSSAIPELTQQRCISLVQSIPDHGKVQDTCDLSVEYFAAWKEADGIPGGGLGDIGNEEFLSYFVCGNDPCEIHTASIHSMKVDGDSAFVTFYINHTHPSDDQTLHTFHLTVENGKWVIADYDHTLSKMKDYVVTQRAYLSSAEYKAEAQSILDNPEADEEWKAAVRDELEAVVQYFKRK